MEKAIAKAFGSDYIYNYNQQLENLMAQQAAYDEQARLERDKGKKADEEKIKDYEDSARDTADQIIDMRGQLAEFFTGTDVTSAATSFANAWIDAYKEFGSTTDAMKEKFNDLIQNMITQSLGAKIMQSILAASGGELSAQEIAQIANMAPEYIGQINNAMTTLMNQLAAAGYNVRQQVGSFTGISRDIAGASEESITGLAAGINTQNFYMSRRYKARPAQPSPIHTRRRCCPMSGTSRRCMMTYMPSARCSRVLYDRTIHRLRIMLQLKFNFTIFVMS